MATQGSSPLDCSLTGKSLMELLAQAGEISALISYLMVIDTPQQGMPCRMNVPVETEKLKPKRDSLMRQALGRKRAPASKKANK